MFLDAFKDGRGIKEEAWRVLFTWGFVFTFAFVKMPHCLLRFDIYSCEDNSLYSIFCSLKGNAKKLAKSQRCYGNIMQPGLGGKDLQEKALGKLILMIHTRIECVIQAMPAWHEGFKSMFEFSLLPMAQRTFAPKISECVSGEKKKKDVRIIIFNIKGSECLAWWWGGHIPSPCMSNSATSLAKAIYSSHIRCWWKLCWQVQFVGVMTICFLFLWECSWLAGFVIAFRASPDSELLLMLYK